MKIYNLNQKGCPLEEKDVVKINYKNGQLLQKFISDTGKILPRRVTLASAKNQRKLAKAIKTSRMMALLPYNND